MVYKAILIFLGFLFITQHLLMKTFLIIFYIFVTKFPSNIENKYHYVNHKNVQEIGLDKNNVLLRFEDKFWSGKLIHKQGHQNMDRVYGYIITNDPIEILSIWRERREISSFPHELIFIYVTGGYVFGISSQIFGKAENYAPFTLQANPLFEFLISRNAQEQNCFYPWDFDGEIFLIKYFHNTQGNNSSLINEYDLYTKRIWILNKEEVKTDSLTKPIVKTKKDNTNWCFRLLRLILNSFNNFLFIENIEKY